MRLIYHQQTPERTTFFTNTIGRWYDLDIQQLPHYDFVKRYLSLKNVQNSDTPYYKYIQQSWQTDDKAKIKAQIVKFIALINDIRKNGIKEDIQVIDRGNGDNLVVDGNHRACIALALTSPIPHKFITIQQWIDSQDTGNSRYAKNENGFYQSFQVKDIKIEGRRDNKIWDFIDLKDIKGKSVLDLGCNTGINTYWAKQAGAKLAVGIDSEYELIQFAQRLNNFYICPDVYFSRHDLNKEYNHKADTVFCFSIDAHIKNKEMLINTLMKAKTIYYECHEGHEPLIEGKTIGWNGKRKVIKAEL